MRRTPVLAIMLALGAGLTASANAQEIGVKGGLTFSTLSETDLSPNFKSRTGFVAGVHFGIPLGKSFLLQPEGLITQSGTTAEEDGEEGDVKISYLQIPLNLRINFGSGSIRPFILAGPYAAFRLSCSVDDIFDSSCDELDLGSTDWGVDFGGGLRFGNVFAEARYNLGLTNIHELSDGFDAKQRSFMVMVGIAF
jgi:hypothetical protein